jgi:hypothetical protein
MQRVGMAESELAVRLVGKGLSWSSGRERERV